MTVLYHWTAPTHQHLGGILRDRVIHCTPIPIGPNDQVAGVWLTTAGDPYFKWTRPLGMRDGLQPFPFKSRARLTVGPRYLQEPFEDWARSWWDWAKDHGATEDWMHEYAVEHGDFWNWRVVDWPLRQYCVTALDVFEGRVPLWHYAGPELDRLFRSGRYRRGMPWWVEIPSNLAPVLAR